MLSKLNERRQFERQEAILQLAFRLRIGNTALVGNLLRRVSTEDLCKLVEYRPPSITDAEHVMVHSGPIELERIANMYRSGDRVGAIKLYRYQSGCGLKLAKDMVETLAAKVV